MRKLSICLLAFLLMVGTAFAAVGTNNRGPGDILGQGKLDSQPHKIFRFVRYVPNESEATPTYTSNKLTAGSIVIWDSISKDGVTVTTTTTSGDTAVAGILASDILTPEYGAVSNTVSQDSGRRNWGWLQTYGLATAKAAKGAEGRLTTAKQAIGTSAVNGMIDAFSVDPATYGGSVAVAGVKWGNAGFTFEAPAGTNGAEVNVFIRGLD